MKSFKVAARWLTTYCITTEEEWKMQTSHSRNNRLVGLGISSTQAAVRGMLVLDKKQAEAVATQILHDKGQLQKKKDRTNWECNNLLVFMRPYHFEGKLQKIRKYSLFQNWQAEKGRFACNN